MEQSIAYRFHGRIESFSLLNYRFFLKALELNGVDNIVIICIIDTGIDDNQTKKMPK